MSGDAIADRRLHPLSIGLRYLKNLPSTLFALPAFVTYVSDAGMGNFLLIAAVVGIVVLLLNWLAWSRFRYGVGAHEIVIESGVLHRNRRSIPFERIQDVDIERGPLERILGLAKVRIETGGSAGDEGTLDSLSNADADALRTALKAGKAGVRPDAIAANGDAGEGVPAPVLFVMSIRRVLLSGLFNFSLLYLAGLFALLQTFERFLPFDLYDWGRWIGLAQDQVGGRFTPGMIASVALLALILGVVTGVARTLARDFGFRLTDEAAGLRREQGLFTRSEAMIPRRRIQLALIQRGIVKRLTGWRVLSFQTLSAGREGASRQMAAPLARAAEIPPILGAGGDLPLPHEDALRRVSRSHVWKAIASHSLIPLIAILIAGVFFPLAFVGLLAIPLLVLAAIFDRRVHRYTLVDGTLFVVRGFLDERLWIVPVRKVQTIRVTRSPVQRLLGLSTVLVDTAGASALSDPRIVDMKHDLAAALADEITTMLRRGRKGGEA